MKKANNRNLVKLSFVSVFFSILGLIFGLIIVSGVFVARNHLTIVQHFFRFQVVNISIKDFIKVLFFELKSDCIRLIILLFAALSLICGFVTEAVISISSFVDSFISIVVLRSALNDALDPNVNLSTTILYITFKVIILLIILCFAHKASLISDSIKRIDVNGAVKLDKINTLWLIYYFVLAFFMMLFSKVVYCLIIFLIN